MAEQATHGFTRRSFIKGAAALTATGALVGLSLIHISTLCEEIGRTLREAREQHADPIEAVLNVTNGFRLFRGKVVDVERKTDGMFVRGRAVVDGLDQDKGSQLIIEFQNENLIALRDGQPVTTSPDLIMSLDMESGLSLIHI